MCGYPHMRVTAFLFLPKLSPCPIGDFSTLYAVQRIPAPPLLSFFNMRFPNYAGSPIRAKTTFFDLRILSYAPAGILCHQPLFHKNCLYPSPRSSFILIALYVFSLFVVKIYFFSIILLDTPIGKEYNKAIQQLL